MLGRWDPTTREAARDVARRELDDVDVDLALWHRAQSETPDDARARQRYVELRAAAVLRELPEGVAPLLIADARDRDAAAEALARAYAEYRATPEGQRQTQAELDAAARGGRRFLGFYYGMVVAFLVGAWLLARAFGAC